VSYKIAVGSSDGKNVDLKFGEVTKFLIYEVADEITLAEEREFKAEAEPKTNCNTSSCDSKSCGGNGGGCSGPGDISAKVELISDCRAIVCKKIGFQVQKQLEKKAISVFDVECEVKTALDKITFYYKRIDNHESLRG
jgi:predicted Fe-Mo cluster-binding NifX family protein